MVTIDGADEGSVDHIRVEILGPDSEDFATVTSGVTEATFDWSHRVTVPGGGMVVVDGFVGLTAPADGYSEVDLVRIAKGEEYWKPTLERKYYVRLPSGRFAAVVVFSRWFRGVRTTEVQMWVNEEPGDRELSGGKVPLW